MELANNYSKLEIERMAVEDRSKRDGLTKLLNRRGMEEALDKLFANALEKSNCMVMVLDVDHFKRVNDRNGHDAGDTVLEQLSELLLKNIREHDILGRWGGEEFVLVCRNANIYVGLKLAEKYRELIARHRFKTAGGDFIITTSIGVATVAKEDTFKTVFKRADEALYMAKNSGRNCVMSELDIDS